MGYQLVRSLAVPKQKVYTTSPFYAWNRFRGLFSGFIISTSYRCDTDIRTAKGYTTRAQPRQVSHLSERFSGTVREEEGAQPGFYVSGLRCVD